MVAKPTKHSHLNPFKRIAISSITNIVIIGAGAAGCFAAANIPYQKGREVVVFEKTSKALQKVKVSGGGRCNVTHACDSVPELVDAYPRGKSLLRKSMYAFDNNATEAWFATRGVPLKAEEDGRMFPQTNTSQTIIDCIWEEMMRQQVAVRYNKAVTAINCNDAGFVISFTDDTTYTADTVILACGGFPKEDQFGWIKELGHTIDTPVPSLFTFNLPKHPITALMGVSVPMVRLKVAGTKIVTEGPILITHWGLSGPAVLRASAWGARVLSDKGYTFPALINWLYDVTEPELREQLQAVRTGRGKQLVQQHCPFALPKRLWLYLIDKCGIGDAVRWGELTAKAQQQLIISLLQDEYTVSGKTTFKEEFVTCGGVILSEINPQTMESRIVPNLYFAGELMNVDGITGGYNFQHAWNSAWIAAQHISDKQ